MNELATEAPTRATLCDLVLPRRTALLVVDVQVDFGAADGLYGRAGCDLSRVDPAVDRIIALHEAAGRAGVFTVFIRLETNAALDSPVARERRLRSGLDDGPRPCPTGARGSAYYRVAPRDGDVEVVKYRYSSFVNTSLEFALNARPDIDTLVVCGLTTECCVETAVRDAFVRDYHVFIPHDASASYRSDMHTVSIDVMAQFFATPTTTAEILACWNGPSA